MDYFLYQVALEQLHNCKTAKSLEELVRKWGGAVDSISLYVNSADYENLKFKYKLFVYSLKIFKAKSKKELPDYIYKVQVMKQQDIINCIQDKPLLAPMLNSEEFLDFFEFDSIVETPRSHRCFITVLHKIILNKPIHFKFKFNQQIDSFDDYSVSRNVSNSVKKYLYALRLKQTLSPDTPSTVLDAYLADTLANISKHTNLSGDILLLQQHTAALQTYQSTYGATCNGKLFRF